MKQGSGVPYDVIGIRQQNFEVQPGDVVKVNFEGTTNTLFEHTVVYAAKYSHIITVRNTNGSLSCILGLEVATNKIDLSQFSVNKE